MVHTVTGPAGRRRVEFSCPRCSSPLESPLEEAGQRFPCPTCRIPFVTPGVEELRQQQAAPAATAPRSVTRTPGQRIVHVAATVPPGELKCPGTVIAASIIWIVIGGPILLVTLAIVVLIPLAGGRAPGDALLGMLMIGGCAGGLGLAFVMAGVKLLRGTAADTIVSGVVSIVFGSFGVLSLGPQSVGGAAMVTAGILALVGRTNYKAWRFAREHPHRSARLAGMPRR